MAISQSTTSQHIVDVHSHNVFGWYRSLVEAYDASLYEGFPLPEWNTDDHIRFMDEAGISATILFLKTQGNSLE